MLGNYVDGKINFIYLSLSCVKIISIIQNISKSFPIFDFKK